jgi:hypothetical protein
MKTVLTKIITDLQSKNDRLSKEHDKVKGKDKTAIFNLMTTNTLTIMNLQKHLASEREQIINAFVAGDKRGTGEVPFNAEQYYSQTYSS